METNSPEELKHLIAKLKTQDEEVQENLKKAEEEEKGKSKINKRKTRQATKKKKKVEDDKPKIKTNEDLINGKYKEILSFRI